MNIDSIFGPIKGCLPWSSTFSFPERPTSWPAYLDWSTSSSTGDSSDSSSSSSSSPLLPTSVTSVSYGAPVNKGGTVCG